MCVCVCKETTSGTAPNHNHKHTRRQHPQALSVISTRPPFATSPPPCAVQVALCPLCALCACCVYGCVRVGVCIRVCMCVCACGMRACWEPQHVGGGLAAARHAAWTAGQVRRLQRWSIPWCAHKMCEQKLGEASSIQQDVRAIRRSRRFSLRRAAEQTRCVQAWVPQHVSGGLVCVCVCVCLCMCAQRYVCLCV